MFIICYFAKTLGLGEYKLKEEFLYASISPDEIHLMETISLDEIIKTAKEGIDITVKELISGEVLEEKYVCMRHNISIHVYHCDDYFPDHQTL